MSPGGDGPEGGTPGVPGTPDVLEPAPEGPAEALREAPAPQDAPDVREPAPAGAGEAVAGGEDVATREPMDGPGAGGGAGNGDGKGGGEGGGEGDGGDGDGGEDRSKRVLPDPSPMDDLVKEIAPHLPAKARRGPGGRLEGRRAVPDEERFYRFQFEGALLTGSEPGARVRIPEERKVDVALVQGDGSAGVLLVNLEGETADSVAFVRSLARRARPSIEVTDILLVRSSVIAHLYARDAQRIEGERDLSADARMSRAEQVFVDLVHRAAGLRSSDILITVGPNMSSVEFRIDGKVEQVQTYAPVLGSELMHVAHFASDEAKGGGFDPRQHQGTRISGRSREGRRIHLPSGVQSLRLQFVPLMDGGQYICIRLLYREGPSGASDVDSLGYSLRQVQMLRIMRAHPHGLHLIVGVTGSGKSTTLQINLGALLRERNQTINLLTVEDPPEYTIAGAKQIPVDESDEDRARALAQTITSALRADPDVIMIGEVRDRETAVLSMRAAMTGHNVWSTLHAVSAVRSLQRMIDEGVNPGSLLDASIVRGLIAQRLLSQLCPECSLPWHEGKRQERFDDHPSFVPEFERLFEDFPALLDRQVRVVNPAGCGEGGRTSCRYGYIGQTVLAEMIIPDKGFMQAYAKRGAAAAEAHWLGRLGGVKMAEHGLMKMAAGMIDPLDLAIKAELFDDLDRERLPGLLRQAVDDRFLEASCLEGLNIPATEAPGAPSIAEAIAGTGDSSVAPPDLEEAA